MRYIFQFHVTININAQYLHERVQSVGVYVTSQHILKHTRLTVPKMRAQCVAGCPCSDLEAALGLMILIILCNCEKIAIMYKYIISHKHQLSHNWVVM